MSALYVAPDGEDEPTIWSEGRAILRKCEAPEAFDALARCLEVAHELAAYDCFTDLVPTEVDVPDDYELGVNRSGARLWQALDVQP